MDGNRLAVADTDGDRSRNETKACGQLHQDEHLQHASIVPLLTIAQPTWDWRERLGSGGSIAYAFFGTNERNRRGLSTRIL